MKAIKIKLMMRGLIITALIVTISAPLAAQFSGGSGTEEDPWQIAMDCDLDEVRNFTNDYFVQIDDITISSQWDPIPDFYGVYNGYGYVIHGLEVNEQTIPAGLISELHGTVVGVVLVDAAISGNNQVGAIAGINHGGIFESYITGMSSVNGSFEVGGLAGSNQGTIGWSYIDGIVVSGSDFIGGISGVNHNDILFTTSKMGAIDGGSIVGGITGNNQGEIANSSNTSSVYAGNAMGGGITGENTGTIVNSSSNTLVSGGDFIGGLVGINSYLIQGCHSSGFVEAWGMTTGGLAGENFGTISNCHSNADLIASDEIGGLVGNNSGTIEKCYSTGYLEVLRSLPPPNIIGGLVGVNSGNVSDSYWDVETSGQLYSDGGEPRDTADMTYPYDGNTYVGWDFVEIWRDDIIPGVNMNDGYPFNLYRNPFAGGDGTEEDPFQIATADHLDNIRYHPSYYARQYFILTANIDLGTAPWNEGQGWVPIGESDGYSAAFSGILNGNHYTISGLYINRPNTDLQGLFGKIISGEVADLHLCSVDITGKNLVGALSGNVVSHGKVNNCSSTGKIKANNSSGGLVGSTRLQGNNTEISNCFSGVDVSGEDNIGGLIGIHGDAKIINSYATGKVEGNEKVGGLVGKLRGRWWPPFGEDPSPIPCYSIVTRCYSTGETVGNNNTGGLIGYDFDDELSTISYSFWDSESSGQENSAGGDPLTTLQMLQEDSFTGWCFDNVWEIADFNPHIRKHYPTLQWQDGPSRYNRIDDAHVKVFHDRTCYWESFPRLAHQDSLEYTWELLEPFSDEDIIDFVQGQCNVNQLVLEMVWDDGGWEDDDVSFNGVDGYKLYLDDDDEYFLHVKGDNIFEYDPNSAASSPLITLYPDRENWVGYHLPDSRDIFDAFGNTLDDLSSVKAEYWSAYPCPSCQGSSSNRGSGSRGCGSCDSGWLIGFSPEYSGGAILHYGKMYVIETDVTDELLFRWYDILEDPIYPPPPETNSYTLPPVPEYFTFYAGSEYESFFISEIENDEDVLEVAVFAGETCVGASVFQGGYPLEILAYTDYSGYNDEISFAVLRKDQRDGPHVYRTFEVKDFDNERYTSRDVRPMQRDFTVVRLLGIDDDGGTRGEPVEPQIVLGKNYPNPMVMGMSSKDTKTRSGSVIATSIPVYLSEDMRVNISVFNIKGQRVKTITSGNLSAGEHTFIWDGKNERNQPVSAGVYFYKLESDVETINRKMLIIR